MFAFVEGNLTEDPVIRVVKTNGRNGVEDTAVVSFGIGEDQSSGAPGGPQEDRVSFYRVSCWRSLAENLVASCKKGDRILMAGTAKQSRWTNPQTGEARSNIEFTANNIGPSLRWAKCTITKTAGRGITSPPVDVTAPGGINGPETEQVPAMAGAPAPQAEAPISVEEPF